MPQRVVPEAPPAYVQELALGLVARRGFVVEAIADLLPVWGRRGIPGRLLSLSFAPLYFPSLSYDFPSFSS